MPTGLLTGPRWLCCAITTPFVVRPPCQAPAHLAELCHPVDPDWWVQQSPVAVELPGATASAMATTNDDFTAAGGELGLVAVRLARQYIAEQTGLQPAFLKQILAR